MTRLAPSILSADFSQLGREVKTIEDAGAHLIHVDVMDGHFVPNISYGSTVMKSLLGKTGLPFDVHLMIENPEKYIKDFITENTEFVTIHCEAAGNMRERIDLIHSFGVKAGIAINPATPVSAVRDVLDCVEMVLVMSVNPGFGGQKFMSEVLEKTVRLSEIRSSEGLKYEIEMDGGIDLENIKSVLGAGTDIVVAGSSVFKCKNVTNRVSEFLNFI